MASAHTKPARWNLQGTRTRAPELWRGIGYAGQVLPFWGDERNYAGEVQVVDTDGTDLQAVGAAGLGAEFTGTETLRYFSGDLQDNIAAAVTFAMVWTHDGTSNDGHIYDNRLGTGTGYDIAIGAAAGSNISANNLGICTDTASGQVTTEVDFSSAPAGLTVAVFRYDGATVTLDCLQSDGALLNASQSQTGNATGSLATNHSQIGNAGNEADPFGAGRIIHLFVISERAWSDAETKQFLLDPFAIIEPAFDFGPVFGDLPAGGDTTVLVPAADIAVAALAPTISTGASVAVPAADISIAALTPTISASISTTVSVPAADIAIAALAPSISTGASIAVPVADIALAGLAPTISTGVSVAVPAVDISIAALVPSIVIAEAISVDVLGLSSATTRYTIAS